MAAWDRLEAGLGAAGAGPVRAYIDPRSGTATNLIGAFPLLPGRGVGNRVRVDDLGTRVGYAVREVDRQVVADAALAFVRQQQGVLGIDIAQLGAVRAEPVSPDL